MYQFYHIYLLGGWCISKEMYETIRHQTKKWSLDTIPAYCITLERRADRWTRFNSQSELGQFHSGVIQFNGVDGKDLDIRTDSRIALATKRNILFRTRRSHEELDSAGGVGCALSHISLWKYLVGSDNELLLIFEDDARIPVGFVERANKLISQSPFLQDTSKWDMFLLGYHDIMKGYAVQEDPAVQGVNDFYGTFAYIMTRQCAKRMLEYVFPIHCHIDLWTTIFKKVHGCRIIATRSPRVYHRDLKTDIQTSRRCDICNIPTRFAGTHVFIEKMDWNIARASEAILVIAIGYWAVRQWRGRKV